jgi:hypothetical protein
MWPNPKVKRQNVVQHRQPKRYRRNVSFPSAALKREVHLVIDDWQAILFAARYRISVRPELSWNHGKGCQYEQN